MGDNRLVNLLLVEDDEDDYMLALDYLQEMPDYDFNITWLSNFDDIIHALEHAKFDLCLLDYQLGAHTGLSVLEVAKKMLCTTPFIMLTGQADEVLDNQALALGAEDFLVKSEINSVRFIRAIRYALARTELANERIERLKVEADSRAKDRFLAHLSHELRTPLTSIMGYTDLLLNRAELDNIKPELSIINNNSQHLLTLLNDVLDLSKIKANALSLTKEWMPLAPFLADLQSLFKVAANKKNLDFKISALSDIPKQIYSDNTRLRQVLINIIYNAIKFTHSGHILVTLEYQNSGTLHFTISDTGVGIPTDKLKRIFKPFEQVQDTTTRQEEGAGLGLAISGALVTLLGGGLHVESKLAQGSQFSFFIDTNDDVGRRLELAPLDLQTLQVSSSTPTNKPLLTGHVLVVEDIPEIRALIINILSSSGVTVSTAKNGVEAVDLLSHSHTFDMVLMDLHMPKMDGREAIVTLRKNAITVPVVALTAAALKGNKETLTALGFNDCLTKPIDIDDLYRCLSFYLGHTHTVQNEKTAKKRNQIDNILLVEDDEDARELMTLLLQTLGAKVQSAHDIASCMACFECTTNIDLVILDLTLPDGSGFDAASKIRALAPTQNIAIVSGSDPEPELLAKYDVDKVLLKPVSLPDLQQLIKT
ncbi:Sensor histidine kinase RcsC [Pseudoalteromonas sp. CIP111854]|uniref:histidine kinase n=1 Tax=Pseudoalteromonas holothuriae TaxID=2963714 RepID=A0A9W4R343_9GAMM|nr:response regulator [Pseudoalteromonas sp. CIP111854]CAH9064702.1 Sensor histidine kinase RcsC [Pseudoalteromonas sp. CIP111854]